MSRSLTLSADVQPVHQDCSAAHINVNSMTNVHVTLEHLPPPLALAVDRHMLTFGPFGDTVRGILVGLLQVFVSNVSYAIDIGNRHNNSSIRIKICINL